MTCVLDRVFKVSFSFSLRLYRFPGKQSTFFDPGSLEKNTKKVIFCRFFETSSDRYLRTTESIFDPRHVLRLVSSGLKFGTIFGAKFKISNLRHLIRWFFFDFFAETVELATH